MKRDFDLIRSLMLDVESNSAGVTYSDASRFPGHDAATVYRHVELLIEAGLVDGRVISTMSGIKGVKVRDLTWEGHDFLDAARANTLWSKAKREVLEGAKGFTFDILKQWLVNQIING